jgi:hypothetical protein
LRLSIHKNLIYTPEVSWSLARGRLSGPGPYGAPALRSKEE